MATKWEDTKRQKATLDKMEANLLKQMGFGEKAKAMPQQPSKTKPKNLRIEAAMKAAKNAKAEKVVVKSPEQQAEAEYAKLYRAGKVGPKNINQIKEKIANKWGVWPNGGVN